MTDRTVLVPHERLAGWVERFGRRHGEPCRGCAGTRVTLTAPDGAVAVYDEAPAPERFGILLVRRGGYAVGRVEDGRLVSSKCGTRYVQGKTKAGGWSQQRYARRRANQAEQLVRTCAAAADRALGARRSLVVFGGGDRELVSRAALALQPPITLAERWLDVPDPRKQVLLDAVEQVRSVAVRLNDLA